MRRLLPLCAFAAAAWLDGEKEFFLGLAQGFRNEDLSATCLTDEFQNKLETDADRVAEDYEKDSDSKTLIAHFAVVGNDLASIVKDCDLSAIPIAASTAIQTEGLNTIIGRAMTHGADISQSIEQFQANVDKNFYAAGQALGEAFSYVFPNQHRFSALPHVEMDLHEDYVGTVVYNFTVGLATGLQAAGATSSRCLSSINQIKSTANVFYQNVLDCTKLKHKSCEAIESSFAGIFKEYKGLVDGCKVPVIEAKLETLFSFDGWVAVFKNLYENGNNHVLQKTFIGLNQAVQTDNYYMIGFDLGTIIRLTLDVTVS